MSNSESEWSHVAVNDVEYEYWRKRQLLLIFESLPSFSSQLFRVYGSDTMHEARAATVNPFDADGIMGTVAKRQHAAGPCTRSTACDKP